MRAVRLHVGPAGLRQQHVVVEVAHLHLLKVLHLLRRSGFTVQGPGLGNAASAVADVLEILTDCWVSKPFLHYM